MPYETDGRGKKDTLNVCYMKPLSALTALPAYALGTAGRNYGEKEIITRRPRE